MLDAKPILRDFNWKRLGKTDWNSYFFQTLPWVTERRWNHNFHYFHHEIGVPGKTTRWDLLRKNWQYLINAFHFHNIWKQMDSQIFSKLERKICRIQPNKRFFIFAAPGELPNLHYFLNFCNRGDSNCFLPCLIAAWLLKYGSQLFDRERIRTNPQTYLTRNPMDHQPVGEHDMPMGLRQIPRFVVLNDCKINIFRWAFNFDFLGIVR